MTTTAINDRFPAPFEGLDYKTARDLAILSAQAEKLDGIELAEDIIRSILSDMFRCDVCRQPDPSGDHLNPTACPGGTTTIRAHLTVIRGGAR